MVALCIATAGKVVTVAASIFTLSWTHSVERTRWEEEWTLGPAGLRIVEARVKGSGAGMEPPPDAVLRNGWWVYVPSIGAQRRIHLAASGATGSAWRLCTPERCVELGAAAGEAITISACASLSDDGSSGTRR